MCLCPCRLLMGYQTKGFFCSLISLLFPANFKSCEDWFVSVRPVMTKRKTTIIAGPAPLFPLAAWLPIIIVYLTSLLFFMHDCSCSDSRYFFLLIIARSVSTSLCSWHLIYPRRTSFGLNLPTLLRHLQPILLIRPSYLLLLVLPIFLLIILLFLHLWRVYRPILSSSLRSLVLWTLSSLHDVVVLSCFAPYWSFSITWFFLQLHATYGVLFVLSSIFFGTYRPSFLYPSPFR